MVGLIAGLKLSISSTALLFNILGVIIGLIIGVLPGLGAPFAIAVMLSVTYGLPTEIALGFLLALYCSSIYGGSISSILIGVPGTGGNVCTVVDGYPMTKQGKGSRALGISVLCSTIGGIIGVIILMVLAKPLGNIALAFGPPEYFALGIFGLMIVAIVSVESIYKGIIAGLFGVLLSTVGMDPLSGGLRYTFGFSQLYLGIPFIPVIMGLYAMSEMLFMTEKEEEEKRPKISRVKVQLLKLSEVWKMKFEILISSIIGAIIGIIPGAGANIGSWTAYSIVKARSKRPERFGKGSEEGVVAAESANNACIGGALVPLLALGVPGSAAAAVFLGGLLLHGITPGPRLFWENPEIVYSMYGSLILANILMLIIGMAAVRFIVPLTRIPRRTFVPVIMILCIIGTYVINNNIFSIWIFLVFGILGYFMRKFAFPVAPVVIGLVLGPIVDNALRQTLMMSSFFSIFTRPIVLILFGFTLISLRIMVYTTKKIKQNKKFKRG